MPTKTTNRKPIRFLNALCALVLLLAGAAVAPIYSQSPKTLKDSKLTTAKGEFDVKVTPVETDDKQLGMMLLSKTLRGDLEATGNGRMLTAGTAVEGSAGYVAVERVTGKLHGKSGSFMMQHFGTMSQGKFELMIKIVPDSGTEELKGISGEFKIDIRDGKHFYELNYAMSQ